MKAGRYVCFLFVTLSLFLLLASAEGQEGKPGRGEEKQVKSVMGFGLISSRAPIDITSETVEGDQKKNTVTFKGNVVAKQEGTTLYADTLVIYHDGESRRVREIVATGNVKVVQLDRRATSRRAIFNQDENKIILEGDAVVREGDNVVRGERITYYLNEERSIVEGGKGGRVTTSIVPPAKEERKK
jgi:lipopolysaccharide export system protein LptA